jgi:hypothetical protein
MLLHSYGKTVDTKFIKSTLSYDSKGRASNILSGQEILYFTAANIPVGISR